MSSLFLENTKLSDTNFENTTTKFRSLNNLFENDIIDSKSLIISQLQREISEFREKKYDVTELSKRIHNRQQNLYHLEQSIENLHNEKSTKIKEQNDQIAELITKYEVLEHEEKQLNKEYDQVLTDQIETEEADFKKGKEVKDLSKGLQDAIDYSRRMVDLKDKSDTEFNELDHKKNLASKIYEDNRTKFQETLVNCKEINGQCEESEKVLEINEIEIKTYNEKMEVIEKVSKSYLNYGEASNIELDHLKEAKKVFTGYKIEKSDEIEKLQQQKRELSTTLVETTNELSDQTHQIQSLQCLLDEKTKWRASRENEFIRTKIDQTDSLATDNKLEVDLRKIKKQKFDFENRNSRLTSGLTK